MSLGIRVFRLNKLCILKSNMYFTFTLLSGYWPFLSLRQKGYKRICTQHCILCLGSLHFMAISNHTSNKAMSKWPLSFAGRDVVYLCNMSVPIWQYVATNKGLMYDSYNADPSNNKWAMHLHVIYEKGIFGSALVDNASYSWKCETHLMT